MHNHKPAPAILGTRDLKRSRPAYGPTALLRSLGSLSLAASLFLAAPSAQAQEHYPDKPVRVIVPFGAGGSTDMLARIVADGLTQALKQPFIVENRAGAAGVIGTTAAARTAPDGYTLVVGYDGTLTVAPVLQSSVPFDAEKDFEPISKLADVELVVAVHPSIPARDMKELIALSKSSPNSLSFASSGVGSTSHMAGELLRVRGGLDWLHIPYGSSGSGKFVQDLVGGTLPTAIISVAVAAPFITEKKLVGVGFPGETRNPALPDTPTFREAGLNDMDVASWYGLLAPAGTPRPIIDKLNEAVRQVLADPEVARRLTNAGMPPAHSSPEAFRDIIRSDLEKWSAIAQEAGLKGN
ncbi:tripartite tricarboxylate transporter substrate binding protein [Alcaligenaceae bacterium]|nr:tripartite tricarboxylate transporter substrate binding protein [Alcaligenaceae bacterium]